MSYHIYYGTAFIKTSEGIIPLTQSGDNNTRYAATGQRVRDWTVPTYLCSSFPFTTPEFVSDFLAAESKSFSESNALYRKRYPDWTQYTSDLYGWFAAVALDPKETSETTLSDMQQFFSQGFAGVKELEEVGILEFHLHPDTEDSIRKAGKPLPRPAVATNTPYLLTKINEYRANDWKFYLRGTKVKIPY